MRTKILLCVFLLFLLAFFVSARIGESNGGNGGNGDGDVFTNQNIVMQRFQSRVTGLENAMLRVRNEEQRNHLEMVMNKVQDHNRLRLMVLEGLEVTQDDETGEIIASGKKYAKLFGFLRFKYNYRYQINEESGDLFRVKNFFSWMWKDIE